MLSETLKLLQKIDKGIKIKSRVSVYITSPGSLVIRVEYKTPESVHQCSREFIVCENTEEIEIDHFIASMNNFIKKDFVELAKA